MNYRCDILIIGSGLAGLALALKLSDQGKIIVVSKSNVDLGNSLMAQGGIAAVMSPEDSLREHIEDTLVAGAGLCRREAVEQVVQQGPDRIQDLIDWGVPFDKGLNDQYALTKEGGHAHRRILHVEDHTGHEIHRHILMRVQENPNITILENHLAIDLVTKKQLCPADFGPDRCLGAYVLNKNEDSVQTISSQFTALATGGAGKVYLYTSNWSGATGDGIAMAYRAGARVANLEFMQFHPTCLYHSQSRNFLISEALRGEGGELINGKGVAFMKSYHHQGSLAPRDIVARSIDAEMKRSGEACVYLDMTHKDEAYLKTRFPVIYGKCASLGIFMEKMPIPVVPAAHYLCGGVMTDLSGQTDLSNLFALGETAHTGLHGANRLASNSLLECMVTAHNCAQSIKKLIQSNSNSEIEIPIWQNQKDENKDELIVISHMWDEIRRLMWNYVGIERSNLRLWRAQHRLNNILSEIKEYYSHLKIHADIIELRNIAMVAELTVKCALSRKESRGIHYNIDFEFPNDLQAQAKDSILTPGQSEY